MARIKPARWLPGRNEEGVAGELWRGCVGYWPMWEGAGSKAFDFSHYNNDGTLTNMDPPTDWVKTEKGFALSFDGTDDYVRVEDQSSLNFGTADFSFGALFYSRADSAHLGILNKRSGGNGWRIDASDNDSLYAYIFGSSSAGSVVISNGAPERWVCALVVAQAGVVAIWLNGARWPTTDTYAGTVDNSEYLEIGRLDHNNDYAFLGTIAWCGVWNRALQDAEAMRISMNPFCMIEPPAWHWGFSAGAAAAGGNTRTSFVIAT